MSIRPALRLPGDWWRAAATRLAISSALAGTMAMVVPFVVLVETDRPHGAVFAALGGLNTVLANVGGAYRSRLFAMLMALVLGTAGLFVGALMPTAAWLAPPVFALVLFIVGMARVFGAAGTAVGIFIGVMFLVGLFTPHGTLAAAESAGWYLAGGLWAVFYALIVWRVHPYRYLLLQLAACYEACTELVRALASEAAGADPAAARRRLHRAHSDARAAIRTAEASLEAVRLGAGQSHPVFDRASFLIASASREAVAAASLRALNWPAPGTPAARAWHDLFVVWQAALAAAARLLAKGRGAIPASAAHAAFASLDAAGAVTVEARAPLRLALLHLDGIAEAGARISSPRLAWRDALPRLGIGGLKNAWATVAVQLSFRSIIFRHALRVAAAAGFGLWISGVFDVTHRLWLPMTTLIVLQPEFGATWQRLWQRVGGTLVGVLIAGGLHFVVHDTVAELVVIAIFAFATCFFIRSHYGIGVVMLTPMVVLLLGVLAPASSGNLIVARGVDTLLGGVLALVAAYVLWPLWERGAFLPQCAAAVRAERDYLAIAFALPGDGQLSHAELMRARHGAERESDNADAILRRMLSEPRRARGDTRASLEFMTWLRRLAGNAVRFAVELGGGKLSELERAAGDQVLSRLNAVADTLERKTRAEELAAIRPRLAVEPPANAPLTPWFERLAADAAMLAFAARRLLRFDARNS